MALAYSSVMYVLFLVSTIESPLMFEATSPLELSSVDTSSQCLPWASTCQTIRLLRWLLRPVPQSAPSYIPKREDEQVLRVRPNETSKRHAQRL